MFDVDLTGKNKYYTLYKAVRGEILAGRIAAGEKLPSKRALAQQLGVSVVTVQLAYEQLLAEGYIVSRERSGYFAESVLSPEPSKEIAFSVPEKERETGDGAAYIADFTRGNVPAELFPFSVWAKLTRYVLADCGEHLLERVPCKGDYALRLALSRYLYRARGIFADPENIVIGAGAEHIYGIVVQLLGRDKLYAAENPAYGKIYSAYELSGAETLPVKVTKSGISLDEIKKSGAAAVHISPSHQFPTGAIMPAPARAELIGWAEKNGSFIIEDDYDSEFRISGRPVQSMYALRPERVIYINTFSKTLAPSMRLGYTVLPPELSKKYDEIYGGSANLVPLFEQRTLAAMLDGGHFERHISRLKNHYRAIRAELVPIIEKLTGGRALDTGGGAHFVVKIDGKSDGKIKADASAAGIKLKCLSDYMRAPADGFDGFAVINYSGITSKRLQILSRKNGVQ